MFRIFAGTKSQNEVEKWVVSYSSDLYRFAYLRVGNREEAEDLVQQTFMKAYSSYNNFSAGSNARAWLYVILSNLIKDHATKLSRRPQTVALSERDDLSDLVDTKGTPESILIQKMDLEALEKALLALPEAFATPLLMQEIGGMKYEEIAKSLSIPMGTVMSRMHRARKALFEMLAGNVDADGQVGNKEKTKGGGEDGMR